MAKGVRRARAHELKPFRAFPNQKSSGPRGGISYKEPLEGGEPQREIVWRPLEGDWRGEGGVGWTKKKIRGPGWGDSLLNSLIN